MSLKDTMLADLEAIQADFEDPQMTWKGEDYYVIPSTSQLKKDLEIGGFMVSYDLSLTIRLDQFTDNNIPQPQETITFNSKTYRIISVNTCGVADSFIRLFCESANRGV